MARRAFIGANRRTDGIRRKPGRAEVAQGARSRSTGLSVQDNSFTPIRVDIATPNNLKYHSAITLVFISSSGKQQIVLKTKTVWFGIPFWNVVASPETLLDAFLTASLKA